MKTVALFTLGCKVNQCDTEYLEELFRNNGYTVVDFESKADIYVINTCTVTAVSDKKSRQMLSHARKANPDAVICATGCYAQRAENILSALPSVDIILGTSNREEIIDRIREFQKDRAAGNEPDASCDDETGSIRTLKSQTRTRQFIKIQEGCNHFCSYCIVPHVRGRERSQDLQKILTAAIEASEKGCREIVLTGIQLSSYGKDLGYDEGLAQLAANLSEIEGIERIRFGSLEMVILTEPFIQEMAALPKVCRHYHIPLQSGSDTVLRRMNRHYTTNEYTQKIRLLRSMIPEVAVTTDIMAGFPGETEEEFASSMDLLAMIRFNKTHVFPYSKREGTPAAAMPGQIPRKIREERASRLKSLADRIEREHLLELPGTVQEILVEESGNGQLNGHTDRYVFVKAKGDIPPNHFARVMIHGVDFPAATGTVL